ncbi:MAG: hypothetical protein WBF93_17140 [Pirellulales bacterium]
MLTVRNLGFLAAAVAAFTTSSFLLAGTPGVETATQPAARPFLAAIHPGIFALFQLLASLFALVAFAPRR